MGHREGGSDQAWASFQKDINAFGSLKWKVEPGRRGQLPGPNPLHHPEPHCNQNIPKATQPAPLHSPVVRPPSWYAEGLIFGTLRRFWRQNTNITDYCNITTKFAEHLIARGYKHTDIAPIFQQPANDSTRKHQTQANKKQHCSHGKNLYYHVEYHPQDIGRQAIREAYDTHLKAATDFDRFIVAFHRPKNLRDELTQTRLDEDGDYIASSYRP